MKTNEKKRMNALDVVIVLAIIASVAAFLLRGRIQAIFKEEASSIVTYSFVVTDVEETTMWSLRTGRALYSETGADAGKVLSVLYLDATDTQRLSDGREVEVKNGLSDLSGAVSATGYESDGFVYLEGGILLIPGGTLTVSTGDAIFTLQITNVQVSDAKIP